MVLSNLKRYLERLNSSKPLFMIDLMLASTDVIGSPQPVELIKLAVQDLRDAIETTRFFVRWMRDSCVECPPQKLEGQDEPFTFSFLQDIGASSEVGEMRHQIARCYSIAAERMKKYQDRWKRYKNVFTPNKQQQADRWAAKAPSVVEYHEKITETKSKWEEVNQIGREKTIAFIFLRLNTLIRHIQDHFKRWVDIYGRLLHESARTGLFELKHDLEQRSEDLKDSPSSLEDLKMILQTIQDIKDISLTVEEKIIDTEERYRVMKMHEMTIPEEEWVLQRQLRGMWNDLVWESKDTDARLITVKRKFTEITKQQICHFAKDLAEFADRFKFEGPGAVAKDLDRGLELMKKYREELSQFEADRQELGAAEKLFDLPITSYPALIQVQKEMKGYELVYAIYEEQKVNFF